MCANIKKAYIKEVFILLVSEKIRSAGQVLLIPHERIYPNPHQPRRIFSQEELVNLAISIRINGLLQPITVRETDKGYEVVAGERRLKASKIAGMAVVPCIVIEANDMKSAVYALIENLQRQDLNYFEEAVAIDKLINRYKISQEDAAKKLGKAPSTVSNKLRLLTLPTDAQKLLLESGLSERHARALLRLEKDDVMPVLIKITEGKYNVVQTERYIERFLEEKNAPKRTTKRMFSDVRIFINTIKGAVETMQSAGISADFEKEEEDDAFVYRVRIPKNNVYK